MNRNLIFDFGMHRGEDSEFYLKKGFQVVAVDANPQLCEEVGKRLEAQVKSGQLTIVNKAVSDKPGSIKFYLNSRHSIWGTASPDWAERNSRIGAYSTEIEVEATTVQALVEQYGMPYYMKIDIEGNDLLVLQGLIGLPEAPEYVSIESEKDSFRGLRKEFDILSRLGYTEFNIVNQRKVAYQRCPSPPQEGESCVHIFKEGATGLFGKELPGRWMSAERAIDAYRPIFLRYALTGDDPFIRTPKLRRILQRIGFKASWYDTHARRPS
jgi:FkbM family methyltransferase